MARTDYSYIGSGRILARKRGTAEPFRELGNCSALSLGVEQETKKLRDFRSPGGGTYNQVDRITGVTISVTAHDLSPANLALVLYGTTAAVVGAPIVSEKKEAYKGGYVVLDNGATEITEVKANPAGVTYTRGTDWEFQHGALFIPATSSIPAPTPGTPNIDVAYTSKSGDLVQALTAGSEELELVFLGLNEANSGKEARVNIYRGKFGATQALPLISDDYAALELAGAVLPDSSKTGTQSQYFQAFLEA